MTESGDTTAADTARTILTDVPAAQQPPDLAGLRALSDLLRDDVLKRLGQMLVTGRLRPDQDVVEFTRATATGLAASHLRRPDGTFQPEQEIWAAASALGGEGHPFDREGLRLQLRDDNVNALSIPEEFYSYWRDLSQRISSQPPHRLPDEHLDVIARNYLATLAAIHVVELGTPAFEEGSVGLAATCATAADDYISATTSHLNDVTDPDRRREVTEKSLAAMNARDSLRGALDSFAASHDDLPSLLEGRAPQRAAIRRTGSLAHARRLGA